MKRHNLRRNPGQNKGLYVSTEIYAWRNNMRASRQKNPHKKWITFIDTENTMKETEQYTMYNFAMYKVVLKAMIRIG